MSILYATLGSGGPCKCFSALSESCRRADCASTEKESSKEGLRRLFRPLPSSVSMGILLSSSSPLRPASPLSRSSFLLSSVSSWNRSAVSSCLYFCLSSELVGLSDPFSGCLPHGASALWGLQNILWESFLPYFLLMFPKSCSLTSCKPLPLGRCTGREIMSGKEGKEKKKSMQPLLYNLYQCHQKGEMQLQ